MTLAEQLGYAHKQPNLFQRANRRFSRYVVRRVDVRAHAALRRQGRARSTGRAGPIPELVAGLPTVFVTTTGAESGAKRTSALLAVPSGEGLALIGTNFGQPKTPNWYYNLRKHPDAEVRYHEKSVAVTAREVAGGPERADDPAHGSQDLRRVCRVRGAHHGSSDPRDGARADLRPRPAHAGTTSMRQSTQPRTARAAAVLLRTPSCLRSVERRRCSVRSDMCTALRGVGDGATRREHLERVAQTLVGLDVARPVAVAEVLDRPDARERVEQLGAPRLGQRSAPIPTATEAPRDAAMTARAMSSSVARPPAREHRGIEQRPRRDRQRARAWIAGLREVGRVRSAHGDVLIGAVRLGGRPAGARARPRPPAGSARRAAASTGGRASRPSLR